jgi:hypothetical protein
LLPILLRRLAVRRLLLRLLLAVRWRLAVRGLLPRRRPTTRRVLL